MDETSFTAAFPNHEITKLRSTCGNPWETVWQVVRDRLRTYLCAYKYNLSYSHNAINPPMTIAICLLWEGKASLRRIHHGFTLAHCVRMRTEHWNFLSASRFDGFLRLNLALTFSFLSMIFHAWIRYRVTK